MITAFDIIYYCIYVVCLLASFKASSNSLPGLFWLRCILVCGLATELIVEFLQYLGANDNLPYFAYIPMEYVLICCFYIANTSKHVYTKVLLYSIPVYLILAIYLSFTKYNFETYPGYVYNLSCFLNIIWLVILLLNMQIVDRFKPVEIPVFWVLTAFLIFYAGIFFFNGAYNYFLENDPNLADRLRNYVNTGLNYVLYSILTYAFVCSANMKKY